jgi:hypothetical protein
LAAELFAVTGEAVPETDPIVTGALFFSHKLGEVARHSANEIQEAGRLAAEAVRDAGQLAAQELKDAAQRCAEDCGVAAKKAVSSSQGAAVATDRLLADRAQLLTAVETHMLKCVKLASKGQSSQPGFPYVSAWYAVVWAVVGAIALAAAWTIGVEHGSARAEEAAVGRSFARVVPTLDPKLKAQLMEHLRNNPG